MFISFHKFDDRDVVSNRGIEILIGKHYKVPYKNSRKGFYLTAKRSIRICIPYIVLPTVKYIEYNSHADQLHFDEKGCFNLKD